MTIAEKLGKDKEFKLISIKPDVKDHFGHYLVFDERIGDEVKRSVATTTAIYRIL